MVATFLRVLVPRMIVVGTVAARCRMDAGLERAFANITRADITLNPTVLASKLHILWHFRLRKSAVATNGLPDRSCHESERVAAPASGMGGCERPAVGPTVPGTVSEGSPVHIAGRNRVVTPWCVLGPS